MSFRWSFRRVDTYSTPKDNADDALSDPGDRKRSRRGGDLRLGSGDMYRWRDYVRDGSDGLLRRWPPHLREGRRAGGLLQEELNAAAAREHDRQDRFAESALSSIPGVSPPC